MSVKEKLFAKLDRPVLTPYTFMGEGLFLRHWSERDKIEWAEYHKKMTDEQKTDSYVRCRAVAKSLCDSEGHLIFSVDDLDRLAAFPSNEIAACFDRVIELIKEPEEAAKNSPATPS